MSISKELLKQCLIGAEQAHAQFERASGKKHTDWPEFYATFLYARLNPKLGFGDFETASLVAVDGGLMGPAYCASALGQDDPGCEL